jgi:DNA-binding MarR family transcriptional regulator
MATSLGLQRTDLLALHHVGRRDDITPGELADVLLLSSGGTTAVIDRLSSAGLITRSAGGGSRRRVLLRITADGRAVAQRPLAPMVADVRAVTAELSTAERAGVERFLARLADVCEHHADRLIVEGAASSAATAGVPSPVLWG